MAGQTSFLQKKILDDLLSIASYTVPATIYLSLHTANPGEAGSHAFEIAASGYARQAITTHMGATDATTGISLNTANFTFGPAAADWGVIAWIGLEDASTAGNMLMYGALTTPKTISNGESFVMIVGQLAVTFG